MASPPSPMQVQRDAIDVGRRGLHCADAIPTHESSSHGLLDKVLSLGTTSGEEVDRLAEAARLRPEKLLEALMRPRPLYRVLADRPLHRLHKATPEPNVSLADLAHPTSV